MSYLETRFEELKIGDKFFLDNDVYGWEKMSANMARRTLSTAMKKGKHFEPDATIIKAFEEITDERIS